MTRFAMRPIIRQNPVPLALPDFRNLGTILRILLAVNALALVGGVRARLAADRGAATTFMAMAGSLEPQLLRELALLYALAPWLARQPYTTGACVIAALTVLHGDRRAPASSRPSSPQPAAVAVRGTSCSVSGPFGALLYYFRLRAKALSPAITEARLQALQARIRPHFLFNSINAVLSLVRADPQRAEVALEDMADLFRVLMRDNRDLVPLADEVELCRQYLALEKLRLGDRLRGRMAPARACPATRWCRRWCCSRCSRTPSTTASSRRARRASSAINIFLKGGEVHAILRNPYRVDGGRHHAGNKMALGNVRERLALHFDAEASLESRVRGETYEVHIRMPYRTDKAAGRPPRLTGAPPAPSAAPRNGGERPANGAPRGRGAGAAAPRTEASRG